MLRGKPVQSVLHILLMVIVASSMFAGLFFKETAEYVRAGGTFYYPIAVSSKDPNGSIPMDIIEKLAENPNIVGYDYTDSKTAQPVNFKNWVEYYKNDASKIGSEAELSIHINIQYADIFTDHTAELLQGRFPKQGESGVVIEESLADYNNIRIGDTIQCEMNENSQTRLLSLNVLGIYTLKSPIEQEDIVDGKVVYSVSPKPRLYTNFDSVKAGQTNIKYPVVYFYTLKEDNISSILDDFNKKIDQVLIAQNATDLPLFLLNKSVESVNQYLDWIIYALLFTSLVMLILFSIYTQHRNMYELTIQSVLGKSKKHIILQNSIQVFFLALIANIILSILAVFCSKSLGIFWILRATQNYNDSLISYSFATEKIALLNNYSVNNLGTKILVVSLVIFLVSLLISVLYSVFFLRLTPKTMIDRYN